MILEVKFAKPKKSPEGKAITDRKKVTAFGCAVISASNLSGPDPPRAADGSSLVKLPRNAATHASDIKDTLDSMEESFSLDKAMIVKARGVPSLYQGIAKLEPWHIALLAGLRSSSLQDPICLHKGSPLGGNLMQKIADWTAGFQFGLTQEQQEMKLRMPTLFASWQRSWNTSPFSLPLALMCVAHRMRTGGRVAYLQGVPGAGKTHTAVEVALWMTLVMDQMVWWMAGTNAPLDAAILMIAGLLVDAPAEVKSLFARMPGAKADVDAQVPQGYIIPIQMRGR
jgi:hypothetical protein